ncbi:MAG TPA: glycosyltransferase family 4 protein [Verrucomicrobiae bacterium]|nr:glycosyltransferase family 4 protein [Verrucomicrobiae bacterium]
MRIAILTTDQRESTPGCSDPQPRIGIAPEVLLQGFAQLPEAEVHVVSCLKQALRSPEKIADNIFYHGVAVPQIGWMRTLYQGCIRAVRKKLREIQPDIVHGQGTERDCAMNAVFSGFPNLVTVHGNMRLIARLNRARPFSYEWLAARLEAVTLPRADGIVCITHYTRELVNRLAKKTWVVPNAVDARFFEVQPDINPEHPPIILCVGVICPRKNQNAFIQALDPLAAKTKFQVHFFGATPENSAYSQEFSRLVAARPWCAHIGAVNHEELRSRLGGATLLALPSLEDNCPMVVLEAAAAKVPVVAARVGGVPDLIEDGQTGLFCDPVDAASIRNAVAKLLDEPALGCRLASAANARARDRFLPATIARQHLGIYREVFGDKMPGNQR